MRRLGPILLILYFRTNIRTICILWVKINSLSLNHTHELCRCPFCRQFIHTNSRQCAELNASLRHFTFLFPHCVSRQLKHVCSKWQMSSAFTFWRCFVVHWQHSFFAFFFSSFSFQAFSFTFYTARTFLFSSTCLCSPITCFPSSSSNKRLFVGKESVNKSKATTSIRNYDSNLLKQKCLIKTNFEILTKCSQIELRV